MHSMEWDLPCTGPGLLQTESNWSVLCLWKYRQKQWKKGWILFSSLHDGLEENVDGRYKCPENTALQSKNLILWKLVTQNQSWEHPALDVSSELDRTTIIHRDKCYFLPTDGNKQMLKKTTVIDKHVDLHLYALITLSMEKLRRREN